MQLKVFMVPVKHIEATGPEMNAFLRGHRVLSASAGLHPVCHLFDLLSGRDEERKQMGGAAWNPSPSPTMVGTISTSSLTKILRRLERKAAKEGWRLPNVCTPLELMGDSANENESGS